MSTTSTKIKPKCNLIGLDRNIFVLIGAATQTLNRVNQREEAQEMAKKCFVAEDYDQALAIICEYVDAQ